MVNVSGRVTPSNLGDLGSATDPAGAKVTFAAPDDQSIGTSTTEIVASDNDRKAIFIVNDSANTIFIGIGGDAVMNKGIRINANGGALLLSGATRTTQAIDGISGTAASNITVHEAT